MSVLDLLSQALTWLDPWTLPWWSAWGVPMSRLECAACVLSLWMVWLNFRVNAWAWPLAIISSLMYGALFARSRLYGEASLQMVFVLVSLWGWSRWLRRADPADETSEIGALSLRGRAVSFVAVMALWPCLGWLLSRYTDSDVPYADALPTAGSLLGQWLLARKRIENWPCWLAVNLISMALFAHKALWLTVLLYGLFALMSVWGWRQWHKATAQRARA